MKLLRIFLLFLSCAFAGNLYAASGKVIKYAVIAVAFDIDSEGNVKSLKTQIESNAVLQPQLTENFRGYQFNPRKHDGVAVPATIQTIVEMKAVQTADGKVHFVFGKPKEQAVKIAGELLDFLSIEKLIHKSGVTFAVTVTIRPDGSVAQAEVKTKGLKVSPEAASLIKNTIATWRYAVDIEDGIPQAMTADLDLRFGMRFNPHMPPVQRPGLNY